MIEVHEIVEKGRMAMECMYLVSVQELRLGFFVNGLHAYVFLIVPSVVVVVLLFTHCTNVRCVYS